MTESLPAIPLPWQTDNWQRLCSALEQQRIAHAYLLCGERWLGKHRFALAAARFLLCNNPGTDRACGVCRNCVLGDAGNHPDLLVVKPEEGARGLKIDQIRRLANFAAKTSHSAKRQVVIIEQGDTLNNNAANALLKTLEEPPGNTVLLLLSDNPGRLLPTVRSRCQRIQFIAPDPESALVWLSDVNHADKDLPALLALSGGKPLLALQLLESGEMELRQNILQAFARMLQGQLDPLDFAANSRNLDITAVIQYLAQTSTIVIKYLLTEDQRLLVSPEVGAIVRTLTHNGRSADRLLASLLEFNFAAEEARNQLRGMSNPNQQLILESMLWRWTKVATEPVADSN